MNDREDLSIDESERAISERASDLTSRATNVGTFSQGAPNIVDHVVAHAPAAIGTVSGKVLAVGAAALVGAGTVLGIGAASTNLFGLGGDRGPQVDVAETFTPNTDPYQVSSTFRQLDIDLQIQALAPKVNDRLDEATREYTAALEALDTFGLDGDVRPAQATDSPADVAARLSVIAYIYFNEQDPNLRSNLIALNYLPGTNLYNQELTTVNNPNLTPNYNGKIIPSSYRTDRPTPTITSGTVNGVPANGSPTFGVTVGDQQWGYVSSNVYQFRGDDPSTPTELGTWVIVHQDLPGEANYHDPPIYNGTP
jgi:hypothetical protein